MMHFIGIDLAWKETNPSGVAVLDESGRLVDVRNLWSDEELVEYIRKYGAQGAVVAIDASLVVPNEEGSRECERELTRDYGRYNAGTYPSNRQFYLRTYGRLRGEELVAKLAPEFRLGLMPPEEVRAQEGQVRQLIEVYPHAAMVQLFGLERIIQYKKGKVAERRQGLAELRGYLQGLTEMEPALDYGDAQILAVDLEALRGKGLKMYEDQLDGLFCGYVAMYWWYWGLERCRVYGDGETGFIVVPGVINGEEPPIE